MKALSVILCGLALTSSPASAATKGIEDVSAFSCMTLIQGTYMNLSIIAADTREEAIKSYINSFSNRSRSSAATDGKFNEILLRTEEMVEKHPRLEVDANGYAVVDELECYPVH